MTVRITKSKINVRDKLNSLSKKTGTAGLALLGSETTRQQQELLGVGRKNILINGTFKVWQRGETHTISTGSKYSADRWNTYRANGACVVTHGTDDPYRDYAVWTTTTNPTSDRIQPQQIIEKGIKANTQYTLSFLARGEGEIDDVELRQSGKTSQFFYPTNSILENSTGGEWIKYTYTYTMPANWDRNETTALIMHLSQATEKVELAEMQLEEGPVATPFEDRSYGEELDLCQRYFFKLTQGTTGNTTLGTPVAPNTDHGIMNFAVWDSTNCYGVIHFPKEMRAAPSIANDGSQSEANSFRLYSGTNSQNTSNFKYMNSSTNRCELVFMHSGFTVGNAGWVRLQNGAELWFDAEI